MVPARPARVECWLAPILAAGCGQVVSSGSWAALGCGSPKGRSTFSTGHHVTGYFTKAAPGGTYTERQSRRIRRINDTPLAVGHDLTAAHRPEPPCG
jgi:hypothetical protein